MVRAGCEECRAKQDRWIYETSPTSIRGGLRINSGASWDDSAAGVKWRRERRYREWRELVDFQCRLIADICQRRHGVDPGCMGEAA